MAMFKLVLCIGAVYASFAMFKILDETDAGASDRTSPEVTLLRRWAKDNTNAEADYLRAYELSLNHLGAGNDMVRRSVSEYIHVLQQLF
jgi:hypothetical protein